MFDIYKGKKVFITGHTGFKGSWLSLWLASIGAEVSGYALEPETDIYGALDIHSLIKHSVFGSILDADKLNKTIAEFKPEIVFHLAAQPIVRLSYKEPVLTYKTNVLGTLNVLEAAKAASSVRAFINVTTDKCYENTETKTGYKETDALGGYDMYSSSKACSEILTSSYRRSFLQDGKGFALASARAGNVIGGGDWALDRLIPDCVRAFTSGVPLKLRNPQAVRPWQFVLEPLSGYLLLGEKLLTEGKLYAESFNFGPYKNAAITAEETVKKFIGFFGSGSYVKAAEKGVHEAELLTLNIEKAQQKLGWQPSYDIDAALKNTALWYKNFYGGHVNMRDFSLNQIKDYEDSIKWNRN